MIEKLWVIYWNDKMASLKCFFWSPKINLNSGTSKILRLRARKWRFSLRFLSLKTDPVWNASLRSWCSPTNGAIDIQSHSIGKSYYTGTKFETRNCGGLIMSQLGAPYDSFTWSSELRGAKDFSFRGLFKLPTLSCLSSNSYPGLYGKSVVSNRYPSVTPRLRPYFRESNFKGTILCFAKNQ